MIPTHHESRLNAMLNSTGPNHWDLNTEDLAAIAWAVAELDRLRRGGREEPQPATLLTACRATLLFYRAGPWTHDDQINWLTMTGHPDATTKVLCDAVRAAVARAEAAIGKD